MFVLLFAAFTGAGISLATASALGFSFATALAATPFVSSGSAVLAAAGLYYAKTPLPKRRRLAAWTEANRHRAGMRKAY